ncbi:MAG: hypothetical protein ACO2OX_01460 [Candidatus Nanopusillus sp.]
MKKLKIRFEDLKNIKNYDIITTNKIILKSGKIKINDREYNYKIISYPASISFVLESLNNNPLLAIDLYVDGSFYLFTNKKNYKRIFPFLNLEEIYNQLKFYYNKFYSVYSL